LSPSEGSIPDGPFGAGNGAWAWDKLDDASSAAIASAVALLAKTRRAVEGNVERIDSDKGDHLMGSMCCDRKTGMRASVPTMKACSYDDGSL
jgi:hypothetical protein